VFFDDANTRTVMHLATGLTKTLTYNKAGDLISEVSSAPGAATQKIETNFGSWYYERTERSSTTSLSGAPAVRFSSTSYAPYGYTAGWWSVNAGETGRFRFTVRSDGSTSSHSFGLWGSSAGWGSNTDGESQAVIVSGPGRLVRDTGGLWKIEGIATSQETTVEIVRKYTVAQTMGAYFYIGGTGYTNAGTGVIISDVTISRTVSDASTAIATETLNSYDKLGRLRVGLENFDNGNRSYFVYDKAGRLTGELDDYGALTEYRYDANNRLIQTSRYGGAVDAGYFAQLTDPNNAVTIDQLRPGGDGRDIHSWTVYDANDRVVQTIDGTGAVTAFEYDPMGRLVRTTVYANRVSVSGFTANAPLTPVAVPAYPSLDAVTRTFYDRQGNVRGVLDGEGYLTEKVYDKAGRLIETIAYAQQVGAAYRATSSLSALREYSAPNSADDRLTRYIYDGADQLRFVVDAQNRVTQYDYDAAGRMYRTFERALTISVANWDFPIVYGAIVSSEDDRYSPVYYNRQGQVYQTTDAAGVNSYVWYDQAGNIVQTQVGDGSGARTTRNWYDARGALRFTIDAENYLTRYSYSAGGRLIQTTRFDNAVTVANGATIQDVNAQTTGGATYTSIQFDNVGRVVREYNGNQEYTQYAYTRLGQVEATYAGRTDATYTDETATHYGYDAAGRNYAVYRAVGQVERADSFTHFDTRGNIWRSDDARGKMSYAEYDRRGMLVSTTDAAGGITRYQYNAFGEVTALTDARGSVTTSEYDNLGQLTRTIDAAGTHTVYGYTRFGELETVTKAGATTSFSYDKMGRVTRSTDALGGAESYGYDAWGNRTQVTNKLGGVTRYTYDRLGRLLDERVDTTAYDYAGNPTAYGFYKNMYEYDSRGNVTRKIEGSGLPEQRVTSYAYDRAGRLTKETGQTFLGMTPVTNYRYDARGNLTSKVAPGYATTVYHYDDLDRVTVEIGPTGTYTSYAYDPNGNVTRIRVYETIVGVPSDGGSKVEQPGVPGGAYRETVFECDNLNRMTSSTVNNVMGRVFDGANYVSQGYGLQTRYEYDANGNVTRTTDPNGYATFAYYDALGRKYAQVDAAGYRTDWTYDANGNVTRERRYSVVVNAPPAVIDEFVDAHERRTDYTYDWNGNRLSETRYKVLVHDGAGAATPVAATVRYLYNALGQVVRKTEATQDTVSYGYDSYGRLMHEVKGRLVDGNVVAAYTDFGGAAISPRVDYRYDAVGNLTRTILAGSGSLPDRETTYGYDGGKLRWVGDAEYNSGDTRDGKITYYWYDGAGNVTHEYYNRYNSGGGLAQGAAHDGTLRSYDAAGRVTQEWVALHRYNSGTGGYTWDTVSPVTTTTYNAYGEVATVATGGGATRYNWYDDAGRLLGTNGDGTFKYFSYDKNGNQTAMVESAGGDIAWTTFEYALSQAHLANINATYTRYDARNMAIAVHEEGRELSEGVTAPMLVTQRRYNAFGEVVRELSASGAEIDGNIDNPANPMTINYTYNTMGKVITIANPVVSVQDEDGATATVRPTEHFYYDQSGRLVAQRDANGNLTRLALLAGTGYDGSKALVTVETHADGGQIRKFYDAHGDARRIYNEIGEQRRLAGDAYAPYTALTYDQMGRLTQKTDHGSGLTDWYSYDGLGQQLTHWNSLYGSGNMEVTDYDYAGRVISQRSFGGDVTTTSYVWHGGHDGRWQETSTFASGHQQITNTDIFGRLRWRRDQGGHYYSNYYDAAGRLSYTINDSTGARQDYSYYNTGKLRTLIGLSGTASYGYDSAGNRTRETLVQGGVTIKDQRAAYDAAGRMTSWEELGSSGTPAASVHFTYDANGNIRRQHGTHATIDDQGNATPGAARDHWFRYDSMNRLTLDKGSFAGSLGSGSIARGGGTEYLYDQAGRQLRAIRSELLSRLGWRHTSEWGGTSWWEYREDLDGGSWDWLAYQYHGTREEAFSYDAGGRLDKVSVREEQVSFDGYEGVSFSGMGGFAQSWVPSFAPILQLRIRFKRYRQPRHDEFRAMRDGRHILVQPPSHVPKPSGQRIVRDNPHAHFVANQDDR
jgi:YD repeat-containing protein